MYYNRNDRKVLLCMLCLAVLCCIAFFAIERFDTDKVASSLQTDSIGTTGLQTAKDSTTQYNVTARKKTELFFFDPNTADEHDLMMLGLKPWQVRNLLKYREMGGGIS